MPPEWDFGADDRKRRAFIEWVWTELDRFAALTIERSRAPEVPLPFPEPKDFDEWMSILAASITPKTRGRPTDPFAGMNAMVWEYGLLRYMFERYWPKRQRRVADSASAASIAVARCRAALHRDLREHPTNAATHRANYADQSDEMRRLLLKEWDCGIKSVGRKQAAADVAYLKTLSLHFFAR